MFHHSKDVSPVHLKLEKPLVLVGLMGAGKTTVGRRLATTLDIPFIDSDQEIMDAAGCSISDIFELYGEEVFRDLEKRVMLRLLSGTPCILATGGGAFMNPSIREAIQEKALSVWLKAEVEVLLERVSRRDSRPLLKSGDKKQILERLMEERYPIYEQAHITIDSGHSSHEKVVDAIIQAVAAWH